MKNNYFFKRTLSAVVLLMASSLMWGQYFEVDGIAYNVKEDGESVEVSRHSDWDNTYSGDIVIPSSVAYKGKTYSVTGIGYQAFISSESLTSVEISNSVTSIGNSVFLYCNFLTSVICHAEDVPELGYYVFNIPQSEATLYVPASAQWKNFGTILPNK